MPNKRLIIAIILSLCFLSPAGLSAATPSIKFNDGKMALDLKEVRLDTILERVAEEKDIRIVFYGPAEQKITMKMGPTPIEDALKKILSKSSFSLIYREGKNIAGETVPVLREIIIIPEKTTKETVYEKSPVQASTDFNKMVRTIPKEGPNDPVQAAQDLKPASSKNTKGLGQFVKLEPQMVQDLLNRDIFSSSNSVTQELPVPNTHHGYENMVQQYGVAVQSGGLDQAMEVLGLNDGDIIVQISGEPVSDPSQADSKIKKILKDNGNPIIEKITEKNPMNENNPDDPAKQDEQDEPSDELSTERIYLMQN